MTSTVPALPNRSMVAIAHNADRFTAHRIGCPVAANRRITRTSLVQALVFIRPEWCSCLHALAERVACRG